MPDLEGAEGMVDEAFDFMGVGLLEDEIDDVIFQTNQFLLNSDFIGSNGPFWWILQMSMCLAALFSIIMAAGITYKMHVRHEPLDVLKILRVLGVSLIMMFWYPPSTTGVGPQNVDGSFLSLLSYIPNCIGSYTNSLYETEAAQVQQKYDEVVPYIKQLNDSVTAKREEYTFLLDKLKNMDDAGLDMGTADDMKAQEKEITAQYAKVVTAGTVVFLDKLLMFLALIIYRIGWWATMYCQQILLGMLTIFGPIQWAFSLLPKWESSWAKWTTRYLTVHFYGAMLYFVGFYVLLLFDIVLSVQYEDLKAATDVGTSVTEYMGDAFFSAGYMLVASIVALKCLNLVPDLAAWMIPEGDTAFSTRNFGEGVAAQAKASATGVIGSLTR